MTEKYLHYIWRRKRLPFQDLKLTDGRTLTIHKCGTYNKQLAGPDFEFGEVSMDNLRFIGSIEMHVRSSDWKKHGHDHDPAYRNVILHVVYEDDQPLEIDGLRIPTLELKSLLDIAHYENYVLQRWRNDTFPCSRSIRELIHPYLEIKKASALHEKIIAKVGILKGMNYSDRFHVLYFSLASAFGSAVNKDGFERLVQRVPFYSLKGLSSKNKFQLVMVESGIWTDQENNSLAGRVWHRKGARPANSPDLRVQQFAHLAAHCDFDSAFLYLSPPEILRYFRTLIDEIWSTKYVSIPRPTESFQNHLIINAIVPFMWFCAQEVQDNDLIEKSIEILNLLPPEKNAIMKKWKEIGIVPQNSYDSQALLALYRSYCSRKKCLNCDVGNKALNRS